jgi:hypothetical protein
MFKPLTRSARTPHRPHAGFAETQFLHSVGEDDYSGFAPTEMVEQDEDGPMAPPSWAEARRAASTSHDALERAAGTRSVLPPSAAAGAGEPAIAQSWATSQWVAAQEALAHEAAGQARAVIAAQRRAEEPSRAAPAAAPAGGLARLRAAVERLLPGLLPLFIGVSVTMAVISAVLPLFDKP